MSITFSPIAAGVWRMADWGMTPEERLAWIEGCLDLDITTFDHADIYGAYTAEALFGEALALKPALRERMQIVSKCGIKLATPNRPMHRIKSYDTSPEHVIASVDQSLKALKTGYLDVLLIHRPDALMDAVELAHCFDYLRAAGKVRHFGVSNFTPSQFDLLHKRMALVTHQIECSPLHLDAFTDGTLDQAQSVGLPPMIWSPLAGGKLFNGTDEAALRVRAVLERLANEMQSNVTAVACAWLMRHPSAPVPVLGSQRVQAYAQATDALHLKMSRETWYEIWSAGAGKSVA
ncbi:aldo/keto reductase [Limnohabitans sp.]|uniref:aldo/keto reductase n=1 Tax=Limnohabitans sp. TaxID=1907725 RepID=UPI00286F6DE9|nr:aldo/keto reductase [Limnohabitans sp.]